MEHKIGGSDLRERIDKAYDAGYKKGIKESRERIIKWLTYKNLTFSNIDELIKDLKEILKQ